MNNSVKKLALWALIILVPILYDYLLFLLLTILVDFLNQLTDYNLNEEIITRVLFAIFYIPGVIIYIFTISRIAYKLSGKKYLLAVVIFTLLPVLLTGLFAAALILGGNAG